MMSDIPQTVEEIETALLQLSVNIHAAEYRWLVLLSRFDQQRGWARDGYASCLGWLTFRVGLTRSLARDRLRVSRGLTRLPQISAAMAKGAISYTLARTLVKVAQPETEAQLLHLARHRTASEFQRLVRANRLMSETEASAREQHQRARRAVNYSVEDDGTYVIRARLTAEAGELFMRALDSATGAVHSDDSWPIRRADAVSHLARAYLAGAPEGSAREDRHCVVPVDRARLREPVPEACEPPEESHGGDGTSPHCDSGVRVSLHNEGRREVPP